MSAPNSPAYYQHLSLLAAANARIAQLEEACHAALTLLTDGDAEPWDADTVERTLRAALSHTDK
jgi:hypothetical protein